MRCSAFLTLTAESVIAAPIEKSVVRIIGGCDPKPAYNPIYCLSAMAR